MFDLHMHTTYCDGKNSAEEMILSAIDMGMDTVGLSGHSFTPHDVSYCMSPDDTENYIREVRSLAAKYSGSIRVLTGIERDYYADISNDEFDYVIGSLHYLFTAGTGSADKESGSSSWTDVDDNPRKLIEFAEKHYGGDIMCLAELYYKTMEDIVSRTDCDIIGHFDLISKFNELSERPLFDTADPRYITAWKKAVDRIFEETHIQRTGERTGGRNIVHPNRLETAGLIEAGDRPVFEINTGAISRGYRTTPYPAPDQIEYIRSKGGILILNSDSHSADSVCCCFAELRQLTQL